MARFCPLFSSSSGNCIYVGSGETNILIDCGVSAKRLTAALEGIKVSPDSISAIFITHEHDDHIHGLHAFAAKRNIKIYAAHGTIDALKMKEKISKGLDLNIINDSVKIDAIEVTRFNTSHDCPDSSGYKIKIDDEHCFGICTDTGTLCGGILENLFGCDLVLLESNHDVTMLQKGPYSPETKRRILSDCGHLSNGLCAEALPKLVVNGTNRIILGHISENNNFPSVAETAAEAELTKYGLKRDSDYILYMAPPSGGKLFSL